MKIEQLNGQYIATLNIHTEGDPIGFGRTYDEAASNLFKAIRKSKTFRAVGQDDLDWLSGSDLYAEYLYEHCQGWIPMGNEEGVMYAMEHGQFFDSLCDHYYVEEAL
jgi:hypothetical protein